MNRFFKTFAKNEAGAIAIDWLLLTATAIGLAIGGLSMLQHESATASDDPHITKPNNTVAVD
ncbi:hypothetical protein [Marivita sp.]|uniref:hypothetical protein n=1 Tax=Marivita sp. TaxID=2003365 RepID=UPI003F6D02A6